MFKKQKYLLYHPESPGDKIEVFRTFLGHMFKNKYFATLNEAGKYSQRSMNKLKFKVKYKDEIADLCHQQWSLWMEHLFDKTFKDLDGLYDKENGNLIIPKRFVERWKRQMNTPYSELSEEEKESDRREAEKFISHFIRFFENESIQK
jgi:hypothetical protein